MKTRTHQHLSKDQLLEQLHQIVAELTLRGNAACYLDVGETSPFSTFGVDVDTITAYAGEQDFRRATSLLKQFQEQFTPEQIVAERT